MKKIIYQVMTRLWDGGKMSGWDGPSFAYLKTLGVDYVWYTGIPRHSTGKDFVKGDPGCPYSITDWMDVNPYLADVPDDRLAEFDALVARTHAAGLKCILDFIPNHVARDYRGGIRHHNWCDGDWTDTFKINWDDPRTLETCVRVLQFWAARGADGFRFDMAELVPASQLRELISRVRAKYPELLMVAEVYIKDNYRMFLDYVGFDLLYDKSGSYDILRNIVCCGGSARQLTWNWQWLGEMQPKMLNFLENHDEQRIASREFAGSAGRCYSALAFSALYNNASFMLYFGQEVGEDASEGDCGRTSIFNWCDPAHVRRLNAHIGAGTPLPEEDAAVLSRYREILSYAKLPAFSCGKTWDLCYCQDTQFDRDGCFAFLRYDSASAYVVLCNFTAVPREMEIRIPREPLGREISVVLKAGPMDAGIVSLNL